MKQIGLAMLTFAMGGISAWVPTFLHRTAGLSVGKASMVVSAITVIDGITGTLIGTGTTNGSGALTAMLTGESYVASAEMARALGTFPGRTMGGV